jgi:hypothetical protein
MGDVKRQYRILDWGESPKTGIPVFRLAGEISPESQMIPGVPAINTGWVFPQNLPEQIITGILLTPIGGGSGSYIPSLSPAGTAAVFDHLVGGLLEDLPFPALQQKAENRIDAVFIIDRIVPFRSIESEDSRSIPRVPAKEKVLKIPEDPFLPGRGNQIQGFPEGGNGLLLLACPSEKLTCRKMKSPGQGGVEVFPTGKVGETTSPLPGCSISPVPFNKVLHQGWGKIPRLIKKSQENRIVSSCFTGDQIGLGINELVRGTFARTG